MKTLKRHAYAKINLSLDVLKKRDDGYHEVEMIMQQVDLHDILTFEEIESGIEIICNDKRVPTDKSNLIYKAYEVIKQKYSINKGVRIYLEKNIPIAAGLAGGSSDAAQTLIGISKLWNLQINDIELMEMGVSIGADIPFCIFGGTGFARGIGEDISEITSFKNNIILLAKPDIDVSTKEVYESLNFKNIDHPDTDSLLKAIERKDMKFIANNMKNVLETVTIKKYPIIDNIKKQMIDCGAMGSMMSGSGPTVFGIFKTKEQAEKCKGILKENIDEVYVTKTI
ncbi:4-(cytidine 5'-diphospho)-2-C-methyl-D-erythritol kinase [Senegalia massiliensis]|uniref:4-(cytidine 5'-diphospho)-2-C-methyl-D-erythritol kinase n=1 Tax=Senegalia massiliensis TaxID=1720316 RepID=UPI0010312D06|nr:4-(cytidine 5'-diphospho)-2-C-methyl-D-erythritol kinase [Senegalia massiliensis]